MKKRFKVLSLLLALAMPLGLLGGCAKSKEPDEPEEIESEYVELYSDGIDNEGYWKGIKAKDCVSDFDYMNLTIPEAAYTISDEELQTTVDTLMEGYISRVEVKDRAVALGDTVNIDYDGKVDGQVFDGGSTMEVGVDVVVVSAEEMAGEGETLGFLDNFLEQLVGHMPGETFDICFTFPSDYYDEAFANKEAVFETTINYILERDELTDEFVQKKLSSSGWTSVEDMRNAIRASMQEDRVQEYISLYLQNSVPVTSIPDSLIEYQQNIVLKDYQEYADYLGITIDQYLIEYESGATMEEFLERIRPELEAGAIYALVMQAVAEDAGLTVTDADIEAYSVEHLWGSDISIQAETYGMPYVKQTVLYQMVVDLIAANAVLG